MLFLTAQPPLTHARHSLGALQAPDDVHNQEIIVTCRARKRKLLPGKSADSATAEALYGTLDSDAMPLKTLATPVAMRVRRRLR